jgi:hypothetical protein
MTAEELKKQKLDKQLADKASYEALAKWHKGEFDRYMAKADACVETELVSVAPPGNFAGL